MVAYKEYLVLSRSHDSGQRGQAANMAASAFISHEGPADEHAALYAAVMGFLDDASVKVRASLAYGLLRSPQAPRPVILALLHDAPIIARAVAQYSPVLLDVDLLGCLMTQDVLMERAIASRDKLSLVLVQALFAKASAPVVLGLLSRPDVQISQEMFERASDLAQDEPEIRGALLDRDDLPGNIRLALIDQVKEALLNLRIVKGAVPPRRLARIMRDAHDAAMTSIGESEATGGQTGFVRELIESEKISTRLMLHALINGQVQFFSMCVSQLASVPHSKVMSILEKGSRPALKALFDRSGLGDASSDLLVSLVGLARSANLADDVSARYFVVTVLIEELIIEHDGAIPEVLREAFSYLNEQNIALARCAARGVMTSFASDVAPEKILPLQQSTGRELRSAA